MRKILLIGSLFIAGLAFAVPPVITQSNPIVKQGATFQFTETLSEAGTWSCGATNSTGGVTACSGSINSGTGLYTAPSSVTAQHVYGGTQVGPNNDVYNTRIDSMPVHANNTLYMNTVNVGGVPHWNTDFPINYVLPTGPTDTMNFNFTPGNNGTFEVPAFPNAKAENGWFSALQYRAPDHHVIMVDTVTANFSEFYQYGPACTTTAATVSGNIATLTCSKNPLANGFLSGQTIVVGSFTGADTYFNLASTTTISVTSTQITYALNHANASASTNGSASKSTANTTGQLNSASGILYSSMSYLLPTNNATDAAGMELQPLILGLQEVERAVTTGGDINHAFRNTFGIGFLASSSTWPATSFATDGSTVPFGVRLRLKSSVDISTYTPTAQVLLRALKRYGTFVVDGGNNWPMNAEATRWPKVYYDGMKELDTATLVGNMEFIDESSIMVSTASSLTKNNREIVTFTRTSDAATATVDVVLMGPGVNFGQDQVNMMAGTPSQQLTVLNNYGGFTCAMNPSTGTLTSGCLYTPPTALLVATTTIITATSVINSSASAIMTLTVYPSTGIYVIPSKTSDYVDIHGNTWMNRSGLTSFPDNQGCCACDNSASFSGTDVALWNCAITNAFSDGDLHLDFAVPNGNYQVVYHYGTQNAVGNQFLKYSVGNTEIQSNFDPSASAGGQFQNFTSTNTTVTNNLLQVGIWTMNDQGSPISSLSIVPIPFPYTELWTGNIKATGGCKFQ